MPPYSQFPNKTNGDKDYSPVKTLIPNKPNETLCSSCGLCHIRTWPVKESFESCVFENGWLSGEAQLFGRSRSLSDEKGNQDELRFGIYKKRFIARMKKPVAESQWSGIITSIATKALSSGLIEGVVTLHRSKADFFFPEPVLATNLEDIQKAKGNKPVISPVLKSLETAYEKGFKKLLVIGASCHIHVLRDFQKRHPYLRDIEIYTVGIPCVDNIKPKNLRWILSKISHNHQTVNHYEFMQDFTVHLKHHDGELEKVPYFSLPQELTQTDVFAPSCLSCFDYFNSLSDITVGYAGAPLVGNEKLQWVFLRTEKGEALLNLIETELEIFPEVSGGNRKEAVKEGIKAFINRLHSDKIESGRKIPIWAGMLLAKLFQKIGVKGVEFARYSVDYHLIRNYFFVKKNYPEKLKSLIPPNVYVILKEYGFENEKSS
ncbi:MAG: Coenzyme F420 hydrogenase/dehydrogenase, beta subunit C-terminal domain [Chloroherpetonaceae bacterium]|nr:Coenzyme F420 hydrogenase/dehydrogenase, beta subunit C-terminal domain [Chloroherpetonaceae bacterium]